MIYFAQLPTGAIKIGYSSDVSARMNQLRSHYGEEPALLYVIAGDQQTEREMHERFAVHRLGRTEQFRPSAELMAFIGRPLLAISRPEAVEIASPPQPRRSGNVEPIGIRIKRVVDARRGRRSYREIAAAAGMDKRVLSRILSGKVNDPLHFTVLHILHAVGANIGDLCTCQRCSRCRA